MRHPTRRCAQRSSVTPRVAGVTLVYVQICHRVTPLSSGEAGVAGPKPGRPLTGGNITFTCLGGNRDRSNLPVAPAWYRGRRRGSCWSVRPWLRRHAGPGCIGFDPAASQVSGVDRFDTAAQIAVKAFPVARRPSSSPTATARSTPGRCLRRWSEQRADPADAEEQRPAYTVNAIKTLGATKAIVLGDSNSVDATALAQMTAAGLQVQVVSGRTASPPPRRSTTSAARSRRRSSSPARTSSPARSPPTPSRPPRCPSTAPRSC